MEQSKTQFSNQKYTDLKFTNSRPVDIERKFQAPVEKVWNAWIQPDQIKQWWGPENYTCPEARMDFQEGGQYVFAMSSKDGKVTWSGGIVKEIIPMQRIFLTDHFTDAKGNPVSPREYGMGGNWPEDLYITIQFEKLNDQECFMRIHHVGIPEDQHDDCVTGWTSSINKLQRLVEKS